MSIEVFIDLAVLVIYYVRLAVLLKSNLEGKEKDQQALARSPPKIGR